MVIRSLGLSDWLILPHAKAGDLQECVALPKAWNLGLALGQAAVRQLFPLLEPWHSWVALSQGRLVGLISARPRNGPQVWEVTHLLLSQEAKDQSLALFQQLTQEAQGRCTERIFLRLPQDSPVIPLAVEGGFEVYQTERLYRSLESGTRAFAHHWPTAGVWRSKTKPDNRAIFQLYSALAPALVRQAEGLAYAEWWQAREKVTTRQEKVWEQAGQVQGWARARPWWDGILLEFLCPPGEELALQPMIDSSLQQGRPVYCLTYSYQTHIQRWLEAEGFQPVAEHALCLRRLLVRVTQTSPVPMQA